MSDNADPFRHHPQLRALVTPPAESFFRDVSISEIAALVTSHGGDTSLFLTEPAREACRAQALQDHRDADLWVFAYGSLIWDPAILFSELRRAYAPGVARQFILRDTYGGRGSPSAPGVMAALDHGTGCHGAAFCIPKDMIESETYRLWRRERLGQAYLPAFIPVETDQGPLEALTFLADHDADIIQSDLSHADQVRFCATGTGFLGTSLDYVAGLATHFAAFGIEDETVTQLLKDARAYQARH